MFNRRLIRIKVFKLLFSRVHAQSDSLQGAEKELLLSFEKTMDLYFFLLALPVALRDYAAERIQIGLNKFHPTAQEANPNRRFVENRVILALEADETLQKQLEKRTLSWRNYPAYIKKLYLQLQEQPYFRDYMQQEQGPDFEQDGKLLENFFTCEPDEDDELYDLLEDGNLYWADDIGFVCNVILKTLRSLKTPQSVLKHPKLFKNEDDRAYSLRLLTRSLLHYDEYAKVIGEFSDNWDLDRVAATDIAIIVMGLTEAVDFPNIPVKVTINEMVELSKCYSTANSKSFVNGILDRVIKHFTDEGKIVKQGRGLVE